MRIRQFSIRAMLIFTALFAGVIAILGLRPQPYVIVEIQPNDVILVDGELAPAGTLIPTIRAEQTWRRIWQQEAAVALMLPESIAKQPNEMYLLSTSNKSYIRKFNVIHDDKTGRALTFCILDIQRLIEKHNLDKIDHLVIGGLAQPNEGRREIAR